MRTDYRAELQKIRTFPSLVRFLRDEMGWPIGTTDFEDLTFEYSPEELGIDSKSAAKIDEIKRLRPLSVDQPWGIFFVKFEPKRLPVLALRRILSQVALKKRASANRSERTAWAVNDLLFISNYGDDAERRITFAHFAEGTAKQGLPTLKVLGWDNLDTALHLDDVADHLVHDLAWPEDESNVAGWRAAWSAAFKVQHREVVTTSHELSIRLAELARAIRDRIQAALLIETKHGRITKLMDAFRESLVHDLDAAGFADMYAQTIAYGLLSARVANPKQKGADSVPLALPVTNPFLRELMETFFIVESQRTKGDGPRIDFDELGVSEIVELLDDANMEAVLRDFGDRNPQEDPVIHFYEFFLREYDPREKMRRGVFYTPRPVVSYIVRTVDQLLRTEFGLSDGLADTTSLGEMAQRYPSFKPPNCLDPDQPFVQILDPATGTGTFLVEVIDVIHRTMREKWLAAGHRDTEIAPLWNAYVPRFLLPRLHGFELLMAPYAIAHLKIGLKLYETGYRFTSSERARIYLTNALEPPVEFSERFEFAVPALAHEAHAVNEVKFNQRFTVIVGNPPYSKASANRSKGAEALVAKYKSRVASEKNLQPLSDDYIKFVGFSEQQLLRAGIGVHGMVTNRGYLVGLIHRGMRSCLLDDFNKVMVCDLHGDSNVGEDAPPGRQNENVFDIQQGVAIGIFVRSAKSRRTVQTANVWGSRSEKYAQLLGDDINWSSVAPKQPYYLFRKGTERQAEYSQFTSLDQIFVLNNGGIKTHRDHLVVDFERDSLIRKIDEFLANDREPEWALVKARLRRDDAWRSHVNRILYRPFDERWILYEPMLIDRAREDVMREMLCGRNVGLVAVRQVPSRVFNHTLVTRQMIEMKTGSHDRGASLYPLWVHEGMEGRWRQESNCSKHTESNLSERFLDQLEDSLGRQVAPDEVLRLVYAVLHSLEYRLKFANELSTDYARIPFVRDPVLFEELATRGARLIALHLLEAPHVQPVGSYEGPEQPEVGRAEWSDNIVWLSSTSRCGSRGGGRFLGVPESVWNFHVGGYQVCAKWLKDRKGRKLSREEITHYRQVVSVVNETITLMNEIDDVISQQGGWPAAFPQEK
jgi:hypothetical protein